MSDTNSHHRKLAEQALGKPLPEGSYVHNLDLDPNNITLVICPNAAYHMLIERRHRAYQASGNANYLKCIYCKQYDDKKKLRIPRSKKDKHLTETWAYHPRCAAKNQAKYRK